MRRLIPVLFVAALTFGCGSNPADPAPAPSAEPAKGKPADPAPTPPGKTPTAPDAPPGTTPPTPAAKLDPIEELCRQAINPDTQEDALGKLKKAAPKLFDPVRKLTTVDDAGEHVKVLEELRKLGGDSRPALPVVEWKCKALAEHIRKQKPDGKVFVINGKFIDQKVFVLTDAIRTLAAIAASEPRTVDTLTPYLRATAVTEGGKEVPCDEVRLAAVVALSAVQDLPRAAAIKVLLKNRETEVTERLAALKAGSGSVVEHIKALVACEEAAKPALELLNKLGLKDPDKDVQKAADDAVEAIEKSIAAATEIGKLGPNPSSADLCAMLVKTTDPIVARKIEWWLSGGNLTAVADPSEDAWKKVVEREQPYSKELIKFSGHAETWADYLKSERRLLTAAGERKQYKFLLGELEVLKKRKAGHLAVAESSNSESYTFIMQQRLADDEDFIWMCICALPEPLKAQHKGEELKAIEKRAEAMEKLQYPQENWVLANKTEVARLRALLKARKDK